METLIDKNISKEGEYGSYTLLAAGATWNDSTSYSRGERGKKQPNAFELDLKALRIFLALEPFLFPKYSGLLIETKGRIGLMKKVNLPLFSVEYNETALGL